MRPDLNKDSGISIHIYLLLNLTRTTQSELLWLKLFVGFWDMKHFQEEVGWIESNLWLEVELARLSKSCPQLKIKQGGVEYFYSNEACSLFRFWSWSWFRIIRLRIKHSFLHALNSQVSQFRLWLAALYIKIQNFKMQINKTLKS